jgi:hypothetical protein
MNTNEVEEEIHRKAQSPSGDCPAGVSVCDFASEFVFIRVHSWFNRFDPGRGDSHRFRFPPDEGPF